MQNMDKLWDEENDLQTSDYFSENTPKSCKSIHSDHKYTLSPTFSVTTCMSTSSDSSFTSNNSKFSSNLIKKQFKRRRLFDKQIESNERQFNDYNVIPLSERQQLAIALQLSSNDSQCSNNTYNTNNALFSTNIPLKSGVQRVRRNHKGETGLHIAAIKGDVNRLKQIIGDNKYPIDCTDFAGWSAIHEACNRGHIPIVEALLEAGSDVNARGYNNDTPLIDAAVNGHYNLVELLLKYGADYTLKNNCNKSAIELTKSVRVIEIIDSFIEEKMRKNGVNSKDNNNKSQSSPSSNSALKPSSPRLTLRFQSIKDTKQITTAANSALSCPTMATTKAYSVSTASDKEINNELNEKQFENNNKSNASNGSTSELVTASSDHNYTSVDSSLTTTSDESNRGRKRRKSNEGNVSSTSTTSGGPSPRSGSSSSNTSNQSANYNNKKHHNQSPHHSHHHHVNHSNKSKDYKDKNIKKSLGSSSDSDGHENTECDKESNPKDSTTNGTSSVGSTEANAPKVPPLRIVLPANTCNTTSSMSVSTASNNNGPHSSLTSSVTSSTSSTGAKFPYVVSSEESFQSESESISGAVSSQRITRSSQRVAQQQSQKSSVEHHSDSEESALHSSQTDSQHPRKRKIRNNNTNDSKVLANNSSNASNGDNDNDSSSSTSSVHLIPKDVSPFALPQTNCYQMFLSIRKNVDKKRKEMYSVPPKAPQGFDDYLINRCSYMLANNKDPDSVTASSIPKPSVTAPPTTLTGSRMFDVFVEQEKERYKLKVQHLIERQKLILSSEQEILRVHGRAARAMANQSVPFSVCSILKDEEIYNVFDSETEQNDNIANQLKSEKGMTAGTSGLSANRTRYNGRLFFSWLQDVSDKWEKTKKVMLLRHRKESESLFAMQRLEWEWKLKEFALCDLKTSPNIDDKHVPKVYVSDNFELPV